MNTIPALALPSRAQQARLLPGLLLLAVMLFLFRDTAQAMVEIWVRSGTFTHAFLVPPIVLWLVWRKREALARIHPRPAPWVLLPMAAVCLLWVLGELASMNSATQLALVTLLVLAVPALFGPAVARELVFPLAFLYFSVPLGEFMVPVMMDWTADFTVWALQMIGVPVYREGLQFVIPSGNWSVVEACSGVRYLIASFMVGTLFAYLNFQSTKRRLLFVALSIVVPIFANWLRALMIVLIGHLSSNRLAVGVDHLIYGWVFFGVVIGLMFLIGARFAEAPSEQSATAAVSEAGAGASGAWVRPWAVGAVATVLLVGAQLWVDRLLQPQGPLASGPALPAAWAAGAWRATDVPVSRWEPSFSGAAHNVSRSFGNAQGDAKVGVFLAYYRDQGFGRKMVTSTNTLVPLDKPDSGWSLVSQGRTNVQAGALGSLSLRSAQIRSSNTPDVTSAARFRVWSLYWVADRLTASDAEAKLRLAIHRMLGRGDDSAAIFFIAPEGPDAQPQLERFVRDNGQELLERLRATRDAP